MRSLGTAGGGARSPKWHMKSCSVRSRALLSPHREQPIFTTRAHVFQIDPSTKKNWVPASKQAVTVSYFYDVTRNSYRIISVDGAKVPPQRLMLPFPVPAFSARAVWYRVAWGSQSVKRLILGFGSGSWDQALRAQCSVLSAVSPSGSLSVSLFLSVSQISK